MNRLLVALGPRVRLGQRIDIRREPVEVGVLRWWARAPMLSIALRAKYDCADVEGVTLRASAWRPSSEAGFPGPMLVPYKPECDLLLRGGAQFVARGPGMASPARATLGGKSVRLAIPPGELAQGTVARFELGRGLLFGPDGLPGIDAPPRPVELPQSLELDLTHDFTVFQSAAPGLRFPHPDDGDVLELEGVTGGEGLRFALPGRRPRLFVERASAGTSLESVGLLCDTIAVDLDARTVEITWRGNVELERSVRELERAVVLVTELRPGDDPESDYAEELRDLPHGSFFYAIDRDDVERGEVPPDLGPEELAMARLDAWSPDAAPTPSLPLERYVEVTSELAEQREPRDVVLARHGLDEHALMLEERAWSELLATAAADEDEGGLPAHYTRLVREQSEKHRRPEDSAVTPEDYGVLLARMERGEPGRALADASLGLGAFMRVDAAMTERAEHDDDVRERIERARAAETARLDRAAAERRARRRPGEPLDAELEAELDLEEPGS